MTQTNDKIKFQEDRLAYGIDELKHKLGVSRDTVLRMIAKGELERVKAQSRILITKASVDRFLAGENNAARGGAGESKESLPRGEGAICPNAPECSRWFSDDETETAECAHCGQVFDRRQLALILAGWA